jgi:hypothetical protein
MRKRLLEVFVYSCAVITLLSFICSSVAYAGDALLKLLVAKGYITEEEAEEIREETANETKNEVTSYIKHVEEKKEKKDLLTLLKPFKGVEYAKVGALGYVDFSAGEQWRGTRANPENFHENRWEITRGYLNITVQNTPWLGFRITPDVTRVNAGSQDGDIDVRIKYYYAKFDFPWKNRVFSKTWMELGQGHFPFLDYQEHINPYRCQGTMFQERFHNFNSADMGIGLIGLLGGEVREDYQKSVEFGNKYPGKYGSYHIGFYNGSGYHSREKNRNKPFEGRLSLRPFGDLLPNLQITYFMIRGKGNNENHKDWDWHVNTIFASFQHKYFLATVEYARNKGDQSGHDEFDREGYSLFTWVRCPWHMPLRTHFRYDSWDPNIDRASDSVDHYIAGISYDIWKHSMFMLNYESFHYGSFFDPENEIAHRSGTHVWDNRAQLVYQVAF